MTRSIVLGALCVCSVARTRCPVSAAVSAVEIVSRSRISPTRITSGSWRSAPRSASANPFASAPISRWFTTEVLCWWRNSIGSSIVTMCSARRLVDRVDHRRERRRLARACRAGDEDEAARLLRKLEEHLRQAEVLRRLDQLRHEAEGGGEGVALEIDVDTEARDARDRIGEVDLTVDLEPLLLLRGEDAIEKVARLLRREGLELLERAELAAHTKQRRRPRGDVEVGGVFVGDALQERVDGEGLRRHASELSAAGVARFREPAGNHSVEGDARRNAAGIPHGG